MTIYNPFAFAKESIQHASFAGTMQQAAVSEVLGTSGGHRKSKSIKVDFVEGGGKDEQTTEILYKAMVEAQKAWEEQKKQIEVIQQTHDESRENSDEDDLPQTEAIIDSENFAIYSNTKFLLLIGKYSAYSSQYAEEGLKALNDYLLILEERRGSLTRDEYLKERALTIYHIGCIFYQKKDYYHAVAYLYPILEDLYKNKFTK